ncbi:HAL/PAL/TAL family ammonia-lyase [Devosia naphthalenivorans]|uniref:HAL/PAL/TAL family ammonia-lyase n=1 Tax=Devosia naphthalenivorans TaxID=2082392 RepID=UPI000D3D0BBF|nr:aromatic amino acid ammonia-lyase [Devosia naphthalenivorans]
MTLQVDGNTMTIQDVVAIARSTDRAELSAEARARLKKTRDYIEANWMTDETPLIYAFNTGSGAFRDQRVLVRDMEALQRQTIKSHATGVGEPFAEDVIRAMMLLRANSIATDRMGYRAEIADHMLSFLNEGLHPVVPQKGSVGASGDLAPLAQMAGCLLGFPDTEMFYKGKRMPSSEAIAASGLNPNITLAAKDSSAYLNGSATTLALATLSVHDARRLLKMADIALSLSLEAMRGETAAFDARIHAARPHPGQQRVARNVLRIVEGTQRCSAAARDVVFPGETRSSGTPATPRVQDVYSLRCAPQVHGPAADAVAYAEGIIATEINAPQDNPLVFEDGNGGYESRSCGHFHAQYLAQAMDVLAIAMADLGSISERRIARLIEPTMSYGLPRNLVSGQPGLNTGFSVVQCSMSALVMENRHLATPGSVDSVPGKGNVEDHVSNSTWCARKGKTVVENVQQIIASEMLVAAQALTMVDPLASDFPIGKGSRAALEAIREAIPAALDGDRWFTSDMHRALGLVRSGAVLDRVEAAVGPLD